MQLMQLSNECAKYLGRTLQVFPRNGWGWEKFDEATNKYVNLSWDQVPGLFSVKWREIASSEKTDHGGVGDILEKEYPYAGLFFVFLAWVDDPQDFKRPGNNYHIFFMSTHPKIIPKVGVRTREWIINKQDIKFSGYARISLEDR
jgi:hypothetical protein